MPSEPELPAFVHYEAPMLKKRGMIRYNPTEFVCWRNYTDTNDICFVPEETQ